MVPCVGLIILFSDKITLSSLGVDTTNGISLSMPAILWEHWSIIQVGKGRDLGDSGLTVSLDYFTLGDFVVLHVQNLELGHFDKNVIKYLSKVNFVTLNIETS